MDTEPLEFFKLFLTSFSGERLGLPPTVSLLLRRQLPSNCQIKDFHGIFWDVTAQKTSNEASFTEGWKAFKCHYNLMDGDFLIFQYYSEQSIFEVKIYGKNGLRKDTTIPPRILYSTREPSKRSNQSTTDNGASQSCKSKIVKQHVVGETHFCRKISPHPEGRLVIPRRWVVQNNVKFGKMVTLINDRGKGRKVEIIERPDRIQFGNAWKLFMKENNLKAEDMCKFEMGRSKDGLTRSFRVEIVPS